MFVMTTWVTILERLLDAYNKSEVSRQCGWRDNRLAQMLGREQVPNAIDAVRLCSYLKVGVEQVFGVDAGLTPGEIDRKTEDRLISEIRRDVVAKSRKKTRAKSSRSSA